MREHAPERFSCSTTVLPAHTVLSTLFFLFFFQVYPDFSLSLQFELVRKAGALVKLTIAEELGTRRYSVLSIADTEQR